jgi:hypothetical protein
LKKEAIAIALGYKEIEFLNAYYNNIGFQNAEILESNPVAFAIKKLVEQRQSPETTIIFEGTPLELLEKLNQIAEVEKINNNDRLWPRDRKWVVKRINIIKTNLQKGLVIKISVDRNTKNNTSIIKIEKNNSGNSGEHKITPENENLSPYFDSLSPEKDKLSPEKDKLSPEDKEYLSTKLDKSGDNGDNGDKSGYAMVDADREGNNCSDNHTYKNCNCQYSTDSRIVHNHPFYFCIEHPRFENINYEVIQHHMQYSKVHQSK